jgi:DHA2 family multidrug resistance protein
VQTAAYNTVPQGKMPRATALSNGLMRIYGSFSTAFLATVLHTRSMFHYNMMAATLTPQRAPVALVQARVQDRLMAQNITSVKAQERATASVLAGVTTRNSLMMGFNDTFLLLTLFSLLGLAMAFFLNDPALKEENP